VKHISNPAEYEFGSVVSLAGFSEGAGAIAVAGAAPSLTISNPSQTGPHQDQSRDRLKDLRHRLPKDPKCLTFLASKGIDPLKTMDDIISNDLFGHGDVVCSGSNLFVSAASPLPSCRTIEMACSLSTRVGLSKNA
jgi:hypothetical protein